MRIVAGSLGGRRVTTPPGERSRPTSARAREALFSMIGDAVGGVAVLDLFAGSGALGLEALSRGAREADFVDVDSPAVRAIADNIATFGLGERARVRRMSWDAALASDRRQKRLYGLVLLDPPYAHIPEISPLLASALNPLLAPGAVVAAEGPPGSEGWPGLDLPRRDRRHGGSVVSVYRSEGTA